MESEKMEECGAEDQLQNEKPVEEPGNDQEAEDESERGRPSTPKWWRPPVPPETYKWEEVRRQRQKGGYPWTHLDKDEDIDADDYLDDNLYEPVNPPPLYGNDSYLSKDLQQVPQAEERMIEIPPEIEILTSEGLDGLDKPDPHDLGFDGDREWQNASEDEGHQSRSSFTAGIRSKSGDSRSTTPKSVGFSPDTITHETPADDYVEDQEVPGDAHAEAEAGSSSSGPRGRRSRSSSPGRKQTAFDILKSKATEAADHVKQRIRSAIPVRPKFTKSRKRRKVKHEQEEGGEQEVPEDAEMKEEDAEKEEQVEKSEEPPEEAADETAAVSAKEPEAEEEPEDPEATDEEKSAKQQQKEEKERKKAEEKLAKQKAAEEAKQAKLEEKLAKAREAEEKRQAKAEEEKRKQQEKEEAAKKAAEAKKEEEARKAAEKAAKEEEARKAAEAKKAEEEAKKAAEKAKKEEEAKKRAEAKKAEEERKAAEKAKKEEEAKKAAEAKKAEEEKKAAEKAAKEEEARKVAEAKKAEEDARKAIEEEARKEAEVKRAAEEEADKEEKAAEVADEEAQPMDTTEAEAVEGTIHDDEEAEVPQPVTPSGTTKRKYIRHRKGVPTQLSQLPNPIASLRNQVEDFKNKLKRSRTPPRRQVQRKHRRSRSADASKSPPRDLDDISNKGDEEEEKEQDAASAAVADDEGDTQQRKETDEQPRESLVTEEATVVVKSEANGDADMEKSSETLQQSSSTVADETAQASEQAGPSGTTGGTTERKKRRQPAAKEKLDKIGAQLKGLGAKSIGIASQASSGIGQTLKVVGKDLQKLGAKAVGELKSKQDSSKSKAETTEVIEAFEEPAAAPPPPPPAQVETPPEPVAPPKRTFRFKRRNESQDEGDEDLGNEDQEHYYENAQEAEQDTHVRNALLGSGARDWESPHDRQHSPGISEERFSGNVSSRDSPPGSSLASSTIAQVRRTGVLEEIDSDEFFLRERGISEGEDEEEVNRFLVEELRQAFRPSLSNALAGFDMEPPLAPPSRPERAPRKPPRKDKESTSPSMYQTFPPERPKRKQPQGYVSKFMKENADEEGDYSGSNEEVRGSTGDMDEELEDTDAMQLVKDKLSELDRELEDVDPTAVQEIQDNAEGQEEPNVVEEYEDDGRYEPINDGPTKPTRTKRKQPMRPPTPPTFYYNTIAGNEWLRELEEQTQGAEPAIPVRKRRGSGKSSTAPPESDEERRDFRGENIPTYSEPTQSAAASVPESGNEDNADYVDEAGYAIVQKDRDLPKTIPRKKKKRTNQFGQQSGGEQTLDPSGTFFSLPRGPSRSSDETPPARPHRTYSTLRPRRPPRSKSGSRTNLESRSPVPARREGDEPRPSTAIGIMQGRPLPPPPRPQRSPAPPLGEIEQTSIEEAVGLRHYANFEDIEAAPLEEVLTSPPTRVIEVDIACQTDPVPDDEFIIGLPEESQAEDSGRIRTTSSRLESQQTQQEDLQRAPSTTTAGDVSSSFQTSSQPSQPPPPPPKNIHTTADSLPTNPNPTTFSFPTKLHLEQLEVDFLRVNDLVAQSIKVEHLQASQLEVNSISATGPVCVSRIQTQSLNSDEVNCSRLSSDTVDMPSIPPSSFFQFLSPDQVKPGSEQELCLKAEEKEDKENESACPPDLFDSVNNLMENENVDSTNDLKSSHVAEKIVDKQLNLLPDSAQSEDNSKPERKDASVGTSIPSAVRPQQLNNLNQTSSTTTTTSATSKSPERPETVSEAPVVEERQIFDISSRFQQSSPPPNASQVEAATEEIEDDEQEEDNVVCGSYTLPYSYMPPPPQPQSPAPSAPARSSSLKKSQRPVDSVPNTPPSPSSPRRSDAHIAFGHTSVAQGDVLSVKLSIPVERGSIGHPQTTSGMRSTPHSQGRSSPSKLPESTDSEADSSKKDAQRQVAKERNGISSSSATATSLPSTSSTPAQLSPPPPRPPSDTQQGDGAGSEESFLATSARLGRAVLRFTMRALQAMADYIDTASSEDPTKTEQQRANMQVLLCLLLFLLVGLILATTRSGPYSSPRWEFLMPPPDL